MSVSTRKLVSRCRSALPDGARAGFGELYDRTNARLMAWAQLHTPPSLGGRVHAGDIVQETWARAYARFEQFDPARDFRRWLFGIAANVLREHLRTMHVRRRGIPAAREGLDPDALRDPETSRVARARTRAAFEAVETVVRTLPEEDRRLVAWRGLEGRSYAECAERLRLGPAAVESRWRRLRERLREQLPEDLLDP